MEPRKTPGKRKPREDRIVQARARAPSAVWARSKQPPGKSFANGVLPTRTPSSSPVRPAGFLVILSVLAVEEVTKHRSHEAKTRTRGSGCWLRGVAGTRENREARILGEIGVGLRELAKEKLRPFCGFDLTPMKAGGAKSFAGIR